MSEVNDLIVAYLQYHELDTALAAFRIDCAARGLPLSSEALDTRKDNTLELKKKIVVFSLFFFSLFLFSFSSGFLLNLYQ
jgi:hypothetical protein